MSVYRGAQRQSFEQVTGTNVTESISEYEVRVSGKPGVNTSSLLLRKPKGPVFSLEHEGCCGIFIPHCHMGKKLQTFQMEGSRNSSISNLNLGYFLEISLLSLILHSPSHLTSLHTDLNV